MKIPSISDVSEHDHLHPCTGCGAATDGMTFRLRVVRHQSHLDAGVVAEPQCPRCWGLECAARAAGGPAVRWPGPTLPLTHGS